MTLHQLDVDRLNASRSNPVEDSRDSGKLGSCQRSEVLFKPVDSLLLHGLHSANQDCDTLTDGHVSRPAFVRL